MKRVALAVFPLVALAFMTSLLAPAAAAADARAADRPPADRVVVMYFHRTQRCPTCLRMGSFTEKAMVEGFAAQLKSRKVAFHFIDFQDPKNAAFTKAYQVGGPKLIVARVANNKVAEYKDLTEMWAKSHNEPEFVDYVQGNVTSYLKK